MKAILKSTDPQTIAASLELAASWIQQDDYYPFQSGSTSGTLEVDNEGLFRGVPQHNVTPETLIDMEVDFVSWKTCYGNYAGLSFTYRDGKAVEVELELDGQRNGLPVWGLSNHQWDVVAYQTNAPFLHPLQRMQDWVVNATREELLEQLASTPEAFGGERLAQDVLDKLGVTQANERALAAQFTGDEMASIRSLMLLATPDEFMDEIELEQDEDKSVQPSFGLSM